MTKILEHADTSISAEEVRDALDYDPSSGVFVWAAPRRGVQVGSTAGSVCCSGQHRYRYIGLDLRKYRAGRLAWLYVTGAWPKHVIDHKDGDTLNDSFENLRDVPPVGNSQNIGISCRNTSGFFGVDWHRQRQKWRARINVEGRNYHLGLFDTAEEANNAYMAAKLAHHKYQPISRELLREYA